MYDEFHVPDVFIVLLYGVHLKTKLSRVLINKKQSYNFRCAISRNYTRQPYKHIHVVHPICPTCGSSSVKNPELFICFLAITSLALLCWLLSGFFVLIVLRHSWVSQVFTPSISRLARCCSLSHKFWIGINYDNTTLVDCLFSRDHFDSSVIHTWGTDTSEAVIGGIWLYRKRGLNPFQKMGVELWLANRWKGKWFDSQQPFLGRSVASRH